VTSELMLKLGKF